MLSQLVEQQSQIITLLTNMVKQPNQSNIMPTQAVPGIIAPTQTVSLTHQVSHQVSHQVNQQVSQQASHQVIEAKRCSTPTIIELLETTDEELEFIDSPSWQSVLSFDKESASTASQTPLINSSFATYSVTSPFPVNQTVTTASLTVTQPSQPSLVVNQPTPWATSAYPLAPTNPLDPVTQPLSPYSVTPPLSVGLSNSSNQFSNCDLPIFGSQSTNLVGNNSLSTSSNQSTRLSHSAIVHCQSSSCCAFTI